MDQVADISPRDEVSQKQTHHNRTSKNYSIGGGMTDASKARRLAKSRLTASKELEPYGAQGGLWAMKQPRFAK